MLVLEILHPGSRIDSVLGEPSSLGRRGTRNAAVVCVTVRSNTMGVERLLRVNTAVHSNKIVRRQSEASHTTKHCDNMAAMSHRLYDFAARTFTEHISLSALFRRDKIAGLFRGLLLCHLLH